MLSQELGVAPVEETTALFEQVSEGTLEPPPARRPATDRDVPSAGPRELPLVGRSAELDALLEAHGSATRSGVLAIVEGEAGIGKSRLCAEFLRTVGAEGAATLTARCHEDEASLPYAPVVELLSGALAGAGEWTGSLSAQRLADASVLLPELATLRADVPEPRSLAVPGAQVRLMDAVATVLDAATRGSAPGVLFVDDVHATDEATLGLLAYLARRLGERRMLLILSWRTEAVPPGHRLRGLPAELVRDEVARTVRPGRLGEAEVAELVRSADAAAAPELAHRVFRESEGLPLFVSEYVAALEAGQGLEGDVVLSEVRGLFGARLAGLDAVAGQVLGAAAAIGRSFSFDAMLAVSGRAEEEVVDALEQLVARGLVREWGEGEHAYEFSHQKLRELGYEQTSPARRRLLHRRIAASMPPGAESAALVAQHLRLAGQSGDAAAQYRLAAERAASLLAHADAIGHLEMALALDPSDATTLHEQIGDLRTLAGDYAGALASYERAAAESEGWGLAAIEQKLAGVHGRRGEWERSEARLMAALDAIPHGASGLRARVVADLGLALHHSGRTAAAAARAGEARELAESAADQRALAQAHNMLGVLARNAGATEDARNELTRSLALAEDLDEAPARVAALNNLALAERDAGELERAVELTEKALALCAGYGDRHREAALENNLADLHHAADREEETMAHLKRAVAIFAEVGADEATRLPEIWKLVSW
jgi:predicted ATPase